MAPPGCLATSELAADRRGFSCKLDPLMTDTTLLFTLTDSDGIESRDPVRLTLVATPDQPPQMAVQLDGIGTAITPAGPRGRVGPNHRRLRHRPRVVRAGDRSAAAVQAPAWPNFARRRPSTISSTQGSDVRELGLKPGQRLSVSVKAADLCSLGHGPNVAATEAWLLGRGHARSVAGDLGGAGVGVAAAIRADDSGDGRYAGSAGADAV